MFLFKKVKHLQQWLNREKKSDPGLMIGFVPTMGALHEGHLSLIQRSVEENEYTVCSIFVNPTQFNDSSDLKKYPRTIERDIDLLEKANNSILFWPTVGQVYPPGLDTRLDLSFGPLETVMEGAFRPGHFGGMAQVVKRLLDIVGPDRLYMGQKDFQQFTIVQNMLDQLNIPTRLVVCDIIREPDGLAMSSRNVRLRPDLRRRAPLLYQTLQEVSQKMQDSSPVELQSWAMEQLQVPEFKPEYFEIVDGNSLQPVGKFSESGYIVACTAVWVGDVRLIDNLILKGKT